MELVTTTVSCFRLIFQVLSADRNKLYREYRQRVFHGLQNGIYSNVENIRKHEDRRAKDTQLVPKATNHTR